MPTADSPLTVDLEYLSLDAEWTVLKATGAESPLVFVLSRTVDEVSTDDLMDKYW